MIAPAFNFDPTALQVALGAFTKGRYQFEVVSAKSYSRQKKDGAGNPIADSVVQGIYYGLKCVGAPEGQESLVGQRQLLNAMVHNEGSLGFSKQFVMAALGYNSRDINSENEFNKKFAGLSWSLDFATGGVGDMWSAPKGHVLSIECDIGVDNQGAPQQKMTNYQPVVA